MADNYTQSFETPAIPNMQTGGYEVQDNSRAILGIGEDLASSIDTYGKRKQAEAAAEGLEGFYADIGGVAKGEAAYYQRRNALTKGLTASGSDARLVARYQEELGKLTNGESQGVLTPIQASLERANKVKEYTAMYPALGREFRTIANEVSGDLARAQKEQYGEDPITQAANEDAKLAAQQGITVPQLRSERRADYNYQQSKRDREEVQQGKDVTADELYLSFEREFVYDVENAAGQVRKALLDFYKQKEAAGETPLDSDIVATLASLETTLTGRARRALSDGQSESRVVMPKERLDTLLGVYREMFTNMKAEITAIPTAEGRKKALQAGIDLRVTTGKDDWVQKNQDNPYVILANDPVALSNLVALDQTVLGQVKRIMSNGNMGPKEATATLRTSLEQKNDVAGLAALDRLESGQAIFEVTKGYGNISNGSPPNTGNSVTDLASKRTALAVHDGLPVDMREAHAIQLARAFDFKDLLVSPKLKQDIRKSGEATKIVVGKAAEQVIPLLGERGTRTEMHIDWSYPDAPFRYTAVDSGEDATGLMQVEGTESGILTPAIHNLNKLNATYVQMRDLLGYSGVKNWIKTLEQFGIQDLTSGDEAFSPTRNSPKGGSPRPKTKAVEPTASNATEDTILRINREGGYAVPDALVLAIAEQESDMGRDTYNEKSGATGPLQVIPKTFAAVNSKYFGGKLDPSNEESHVHAGLALLNELWERYDGNLDQILSDYHGGPDLNMDQADQEGKVNRDYVRDVKQRIRKRKGG